MSSLSPGVTVCPSTVTLQKRQSHMSINYHWVFIGQLLTNGVKLLKLLKSGGARVGLCPPQSPLNNWSARDSKYIEGSSCSSRRVLWKKENTIINKMFSRVHTCMCVIHIDSTHGNGLRVWATLLPSFQSPQSACGGADLLLYQKHILFTTRRRAGLEVLCIVVIPYPLCLLKVN